jgi:hypothetical protein
MDYPHPIATLAADGSIDLSDAYAVGAGAWDRVAIAYGYQDFPAGTDQAAALDRLLVEAERAGITFLTDQDARPRGSAHPLAHLWDNGVDPVAELEQMMRVRRAALDRFSESVLRRGAPLALMEEALMPIYLRHRFQIEAVAKAIAGRSYAYARRGDGRQPPRSVPPGEQTRALGALLETIESEQLTLPASVLDNLPPRPFTYPSHREMFPRYTGLVPDVITPAVVAADLTVSMILQPQRAARLVEQHALDRRLPGLEQVIDQVIEHTFGERPSDGYQAEVNRAVERVVVDRLIGLAGTAPMPQVRAVSAWRLDRLRQRLDRDADRLEEADQAHYFLLAADIGRFLARDLGAVAPPEPPAPPPGSPIGAPNGGRDRSGEGC